MVESNLSIATQMVTETSDMESKMRAAKVQKIWESYMQYWIKFIPEDVVLK